jgi:hypothetical protein
LVVLIQLAVNPGNILQDKGDLRVIKPVAPYEVVQKGLSSR